MIHENHKETTTAAAVPGSYLLLSLRVWLFPYPICHSIPRSDWCAHACILHVYAPTYVVGRISALENVLTKPRHDLPF